MEKEDNLNSNWRPGSFKKAWETQSLLPGIGRLGVDGFPVADAGLRNVALLQGHVGKAGPLLGVRRGCTPTTHISNPNPQ